MTAHDPLAPCPCTTSAAPCHPRCTCVMPSSSRGCNRCARYGSLEQRAMAQAYLWQLEGFI